MNANVTTQNELDAAIKAGSTDIVINSPAGVWLELRPPATSSVVAWGSSRVVAWGSSRVVAWGSSSVEAWGSSSVVAWGSSSVVAWGSSSVEAWGSSRVVAWGSSSVVARGSSSVVAWGSSRVVAWESSRVEAWGSSRVVAAKYVAVHLFSKKVALTGEGHIIDVTDLDLNKADDWLAWNGVKVTRGKALLFKAVDDDLMAGLSYKPTKYGIGDNVTAADWRPTNDCGFGLHFASSPSGAKNYFNGGNGGPRFLAVEVAVKDLVVLGDKCKAPTCKVLYEVDIHGDKVEQPAAVKA